LNHLNVPRYRSYRANPPFCEQASLKCRYTALLGLDPTGDAISRTLDHAWKAALNAFDARFEGCLSLGRI
jgi:hypothetical protein